MTRRPGGEPARPAPAREGAGRWVVWTAGLVVATGAGVATAHGLYQVAAAARVPAVIAWLYPLITDGLALVAYAATARLHHGGRRYAATIVILAAGLSGLAQATYLTGSLTPAGHTTVGAPAALRFGVGAWPAIAAALAAHLLHLVGTDTPPAASTGSEERPASTVSSNPPASNPPVSNRAPDPVGQSRPTVDRPTRPVQPGPGQVLDTRPPVNSAEPSRLRGDRPGLGGSARDRALAAARAHRDTHGTLPTARDLATLAGTSTGTAGSVLKELRDNRPSLHVVNDGPENRTEQ
jgi:hypothetical protein